VTIISHSHQFIFIKARKVASSSVLVALGKHCAGTDIVTAPGDTEGHPNSSINSIGFKTHTAPEDIKRIVTPEQWQGYTKIACVRNPWDVAVSKLLWRFYRGGKRWNIQYSDSFQKAVQNQSINVKNPEYRNLLHTCINDLQQNCDFFFTADGVPNADVYLRFETLQDDFDALSDQLGLPRSQLPKLKSQSRATGWDYREFFDDDLEAAVYQAAKRTIDYFNYTF